MIVPRSSLKSFRKSEDTSLDSLYNFPALGKASNESQSGIDIRAQPVCATESCDRGSITEG